MDQAGPRVAIIGAGIAGLSCAARLRAAGIWPVVFEKSRGIGGRTATRRAQALRFDHGAQYVTAKGPGFAMYLGRAITAGHASRWGAPALGRHVGLPGMSGLAQPLADGVEIRFGTEIRAARHGPDGWTLSTDDGPLADRFDRLVCTCPAPQALRLFPDLGGALAHVEMAPCWALMLALDTPMPHLPDAEKLSEGPLSFVARNASKPARDPGPETWVIHASPDWSRAHLELEKETVRDLLAQAFAAHAGQAPAIAHATAHRWRFAMVTRPLGQPFLSARDGHLLLGGDWALGPRVEAAFDSGHAMAKALIG
ncbi:NAD(P)/FAD-dependent oxidoreductase [Halovulum dunhuangense]|nr:FAD-dependent oxidoreductase [Halovulum dunhuangense]